MSTIAFEETHTLPIPGPKKRVRRPRFLNRASIFAQRRFARWKQTQATTSLRLRVVLLYGLLMTTNLVFFSGMIFENQLDLLVEVFTLRSEKVGAGVARVLRGRNLNPQDAGFRAAVRGQLLSQGIEDFVLCNGTGERFGDESNDAAGAALELPADLVRRIQEISNSSGVSQAPYVVRLDPATFTVQYLIQVGADAYIFASGSIAAINDALNRLYWQMFLAIGLGVIFHFLFGVYVFRLMFRRLGFLKQAADRMSDGALDVRADYKGRKGDEIDALSDSFNAMAARIEEMFGSLRRREHEIQKELEVGKTVQEMLLSAPEIMAEYQPALFYLPMREVSGDIYGFHNFSDTLKGVILADATGHGVSAALITSILYFHLQNALRETLNPARVMRMTSAALRETLRSDYFATAFFALLDARGKMYFTNAGHNPIYYYRRRRNAVIPLEATGVWLGMPELQPYELKMVRTEPGDRLFLYSDGLTESRDDQDEMFGEARLERLIIEGADISTEAVVDRIREDFFAHATSIADDVTMLMLEFPEYK